VTQNRAMKILSIRKPWAYLITRGSKNIENRSWPTNYRGPVLIHASLKIDKQLCVDHGLDPTKLETGGVVGVAEIVDCVTTHRSRWFEGPYGFVLKNRRGLRFVRWTGALGLRDAPKRLLDRIGRIRSSPSNPSRVR
jgi:ASCH domain-containing protein